MEDLDARLEPPEDTRAVVAYCYFCGEPIREEDEEYYFEFAKVGEVHICAECGSDAHRTAYCD